MRVLSSSSSGLAEDSPVYGTSTDNMTKQPSSITLKAAELRIAGHRTILRTWTSCEERKVDSSSHKLRFHVDKTQQKEILSRTVLISPVFLNSASPNPRETASSPFTRATPPAACTIGSVLFTQREACTLQRHFCDPQMVARTFSTVPPQPHCL